MAMETVFSLLEQGTTLLTANQRLARNLQQAYAVHQHDRGLRAWPSPDILPLAAWLERQWNEYIDRAPPGGGRVPLLLNGYQEQALWARIIGDSPDGPALLHLTATAHAAAEAWRLVKQYRLVLTGKHGELNEDARAFVQWSRRYADACVAANWLDRGSLVDFVIAGVREAALPLPTQVLLSGFDEFTPQQRQLWDTLRTAGCAVSEIETAAEAGQVARVAHADTDSEIRAAARWARALLQGPAPGTIGVVVPDLNATRACIEHIFTEVLLPSALLTGEGATAVVNLSLGRPLNETPLAANALLLLTLARGPMSLDDVSRILRSPFLSGAEVEMMRRARLDALLRELGESEISLQTLIRLAQRDGTATCPLLAECLIALRQSVATSARELPPSVWTERFSHWLALLGWPGERALDSEEYQAAMAWRALLAGFGALDAITGRQPLGEALAALRGLAADIVFQPQQEGARVQVLGMLEATGLRFDHLWVLGLHDEVWPPPPRPNPFLPVALQRTHGLPHASAERELAFCRRVTERLLTSASDVVVSYPQREGDRVLAPSALIAGLPALDPVSTSPPPTAYADLIYASRQVQALVDEAGPPLPERFVIRGGASVFKHQAACPFRAFSMLRLGAVGLGQAQVGLSPQERGTLVHLALDALWQRLRSHAELMAMGEQAVRALTEEVAQAVVAQVATEHRDLFTPAFVRLEQRRLAELLQQWLAQEKTRAPFTVLEREQGHTLSLGGLTVNARIDRIDRLADGRCVIIDYKTGIPSEADWFGPRPEEPQLPLYAVAVDRPLAAILFGQVVRGDMRFRGVAAVEGVAPGIKPHDEHRHARDFASWEAMLADWQAVLTRLAQDFRAGRAPVDPKDAATCRYCECAPLCRVHELHALGLDDAEQGGGGD